MKKLSTFALAAVVTGAALNHVPMVQAEALVEKVDEPSEVEQEQVETTDYIKVSGVISELKQDEGQLSIIVEKSDELQTVFPISDDVLMFDSHSTESFPLDKLAEGQTVDVYYDKNIVIPMIYPVVIPPEIVIVHHEQEMGQVKVAKFDENGLSLDEELQLNISEETTLLNEKGEQIQMEDLSEKELIVFYSQTTKSIPPQTTPIKVIALDPLDPLMEEIEQVIGDNFYMKDGVKMIPIRSVSEYLGYEVTWHRETHSVTVENSDRSFSISIGEEEYGYNDSLVHFTVSPDLLNRTTYVPEQFIELLRIN